MAITASVAVIFYIAGIVIMAIQIRCCKARIAEPFAWLVACIFGLIYYVVFLLDYQDGKVNGATYNYWSIAVRVDFLVTLLVIEGARLYRMKKKNGS